MMNPFDFLPTDPKMLLIVSALAILMGATLVALFAVALRTIITGEPPTR